MFRKICDEFNIQIFVCSALVVNVLNIISKCLILLAGKHIAVIVKLPAKLKLALCTANATSKVFLKSAPTHTHGRL